MAFLVLVFWRTWTVEMLQGQFVSLQASWFWLMAVVFMLDKVPFERVNYHSKPIICSLRTNGSCDDMKRKIWHADGKLQCSGTTPLTSSGIFQHTRLGNVKDKVPFWGAKAERFHNFPMQFHNDTNTKCSFTNWVLSAMFCRNRTTRFKATLSICFKQVILVLESLRHHKWFSTQLVICYLPRCAQVMQQCHSTCVHKCVIIKGA